MALGQAGAYRAAGLKHRGFSEGIAAAGPSGIRGEGDIENGAQPTPSPGCGAGFPHGDGVQGRFQRLLQGAASHSGTCSPSRIQSRPLPCPRLVPSAAIPKVGTHTAPDRGHPPALAVVRAHPCRPQGFSDIVYMQTPNTFSLQLSNGL